MCVRVLFYFLLRKREREQVSKQCSRSRSRLLLLSPCVCVSLSLHPLLDYYYISRLLLTIIYTFFCFGVGFFAYNTFTSNDELCCIGEIFSFLFDCNNDFSRTTSSKIKKTTNFSGLYAYLFFSFLFFSLYSMSAHTYIYIYIVRPSLLRCMHKEYSRRFTMNNASLVLCSFHLYLF